MTKRTSLCGTVSVIALSLMAMQTEAQNAENSTMETVVVTGIRASLEKGLEVKRASTQVVESIAAEDIGKFPDNNVVEALQRISGVQVTDRSGGEVSTLSIRGMSDIETTWNGRKVFTSSGRYFSVQDMPATIVSRLDAYKTRGADQLESGIGGVIDVKTRRPFDFDGFKFSVQARDTYQEKAGAFDPNISALLSNTWNTGIGKVGALVNVSWSTIHYRDESATPGAMIPFASADVYDHNGTRVLYAGERVYSTYTSSPLSSYSPSYVLNGQPVQVTIWQPGQNNGLSLTSGSTLTAYEHASTTSSTKTGNTITIPYVMSRDAVFLSDNKGKTTRPNMNVAFQWQPNENALYTLEFMYNGYQNNNDNNMLFSFVDWWGAFADGGALDGQFLNSITTYDGTNIVKTRHVKDVYGFNSGDFTKSKTNSYVYAANAIWSISDRFTLTADASYQTSTYNTSFLAMRITRTASDIYVDYNQKGGNLAFNFGDGEYLLTEPSAWTTGTLYDNGNTSHGSAYTLSFDGVYDLDGTAGPLKKVSFGLRYDDRGASAGERTASGDFSENLATLAASHSGILTYNSKFFEGVSDVPDAWVNVSGSYLYKHRDEIRKLWGGNLTSAIRHNMFTNFKIDEINTAAYLTADFEQDVFSNPLTISGGVRWVEIKDTTKFWNYDYYLASDTLGKLSQENGSGYAGDFLPSVTVSYTPLDSLKLRFNYGQTLRAPGFSDLNPTRTLNADVTKIGYGTGSQGNPTLKPTKSRNYDLTAEWYFAPNSALYTTFFRRDITGLVVSLKQSINLAGDDILTEYKTNNFIITKPMNSSKGYLKGIEIGTVYFPDYLPGILDGLGFQGSMTFLGSSQNVPQTNDLGEVTSEIKQPFYGISSVSYNSTLIYEHGNFGSRLSYVWRSHWHNADEAASFGNPLGIWRRGESSLDMSASYKLFDGGMITFDAINLLNGKQKQYYFNNGYGSKDTTNFGTTLLTRSFTLGFRLETN